MLSCGCTCVMAEAVLPNDWIPSGSIRQNRKEEKNSMSKHKGQLSHKKEPGKHVYCTGRKLSFS